MEEWGKNVYFVLVEPRESGNIGASARALKNMGFKNLCIVNPPPVVTGDARRLACNALDVLEGAEYYNNLDAAIGDKSIIAGIARRTGRGRGLILTVERGAEKIAAAACSNKVALLFGREDRGLYNEEVEKCGLLLTIPSNKEHPSLNLSHAVMVTAYELSKAFKGQDGGGGSGFFSQGQKLVSRTELVQLYERIEDILKLLDYIPQGSRNLERKIMKNLKFFINRAGITSWEMKMLYGICSQIEKKFKRY